MEQVLIGNDGSIIKCIAFNAVENDIGAYLLKKNNKSFNIAGKLSLNEWKGQSNVEFIIDDISVNKTFKNMVPSSIGQDSWFSSNKEGFDSPWDRQEIKNYVR